MCLGTTHQVFVVVTETDHGAATAGELDGGSVLPPQLHHPNVLLAQRRRPVQSAQNQVTARSEPCGDIGGYI